MRPLADALDEDCADRTATSTRPISEARSTYSSAGRNGGLVITQSNDEASIGSFRKSRTRPNIWSYASEPRTLLKGSSSALQYGHVRMLRDPPQTWRVRPRSTRMFWPVM